jgi:hypothetical protein
MDVFLYLSGVSASHFWRPSLSHMQLANTYSVLWLLLCRMGRRAGAVLSLLVIVMLCSCRCEPLPSRRELQTVIAHSGSSFLPLHRPLLPVLGTTGAGVAVSISAGPPTEKASGSGNGNSGANMQGE